MELALQPSIIQENLVFIVSNFVSIPFSDTERVFCIYSICIVNSKVYITWEERRWGITQFHSIIIFFRLLSFFNNMLWQTKCKREWRAWLQFRIIEIIAKCVFPHFIAILCKTGNRRTRRIRRRSIEFCALIYLKKLMMAAGRS